MYFGRGEDQDLTCENGKRLTELPGVSYIRCKQKAYRFIRCKLYPVYALSGVSFIQCQLTASIRHPGLPQKTSLCCLETRKSRKSTDFRLTGAV